MTIDVTIRNEGNLIAFTAHSEAAREWFDTHVESEGWQWLGSTLCVDHGYADAITCGLLADGLRVE
jgi:hypothetical protein